MEDPQSTLEKVVEDFADRLESGDQPTIQEYKDQHPHLANRIDAALRGLLALENVESQPHQNSSLSESLGAKTIGEYQIIREIGRGGMGVVFEARHSTMRRRVALKILPENLTADESFVSRFLIEARSAGSLHHTNIVPVFEVGQADGIHYYSMQYINGDNLDRVIDDIKILRSQSQNHNSHGDSPQAPSVVSPCQSAIQLTETTRPLPIADSPTQRLSATSHPRAKTQSPPQAFEKPSASLSDSVFGNETTTVSRPGNHFHRRVAAVGIQVAEALHYAHKNGVLHRDIKPANLILDTEGTVWLTDFGLAKHEDDLTRTGDVIGTLRYMAPERFSGNADSRSDIYSLGLTLYELCVLRPAFNSNDQAELVKLIQQSSPIQPRRIDPSIPTDLETIVLKTLETQPERRYQSGQELAEDLRRFLADRPIKARRISLIEHAYRTCRRNPVTTSLLACILGLLILLTAASVRFAMVSDAKSRVEMETRKESQRELYETKLDQAKLSRQSRQLGQRFSAIKSIQSATAIAPQLGFNEQEQSHSQMLLRNETIAALCLTDMQEIQSISPDDHWGAFGAVTFDSTYSMIAEGHPSGSVRLRSLDESIEQSSPTLFSKQKHPARVLKLSPDGRYLGATYNAGNAIYRDVEFLLWDSQNPQSPLIRMKGVVDFEFDHRSQKLAMSLFRDSVKVISLKDLSQQTIQGDFKITPRLVRFDGTGEQLAVSSGAGSISIWFLDEDPVLTSNLTSPDNVTAMDWGTAPSILAVGTRRGKIFYWRDNLGGPPESIDAHQDEVTHLHIHPSRALIASRSQDASIRMNNLTADQESLRIRAGDSLLHCGFGHNGMLGFFNQGKSIAGVWEFANPLVSVFNDSKNSIGQTVAFHPTMLDLVVRATADGIEFWDAKRKHLVHFLEFPNTSHFVLHPHGKFLYTCGGNGIEKWPLNIEPDSEGFKVRVGKAIRIFDQETDQLVLDSSGSLLVAGTKFDIVALDSSNGNPSKQFGRHTSVNSLAHIKNEKLLLSGTMRNQGIAVWNWDSGKKTKTLLPHIAGISVAANPADSSQFATAASSVQIWNADDWSSMDAGMELDKTNALIRYSNDGKLILVNNSVSEVTLFDSKTGKKLATIPAVKSDRIVDFAWSNDGSKLALSCYGSLQIVDLDAIQLQLGEMGLGW